MRQEISDREQEGRACTEDVRKEDGAGVEEEAIKDREKNGQLSC